MAKIPVEEKKEGSSWWAWLIGLIVLGVILWLIFGAFGDGPVEEPAGPVEEPIAEGPFTSITTIFDADPEAVAGRGVDLASVLVSDVISDNIFFITSQEGTGNEQLLVVLDEVVPAPSPNVEGRYNVNPGQVVSIAGTLTEVDPTAFEGLDLTDAEREPLMNENIYLLAQELTILEQEAAQQGATPEQ